MSRKDEKRLSPSSEAIASAVGDETVILHLKTGAYYGLDPVATRIYQLLKEGRSPAAICAQMVEEYDVSQTVIEADVKRLLAELEETQIVVNPDHSDD